MISNIRAGASPAFQKVCHCSRGLKIRSPGLPNHNGISEQSPGAAFKYKAIFVLAMMSVHGSCQSTWLHRMLDKRKTFAGALVRSIETNDRCGPPRRRCGAYGQKQASTNHVALGQTAVIQTLKLGLESCGTNSPTMNGLSLSRYCRTSRVAFLGWRRATTGLPLTTLPSSFNSRQSGYGCALSAS
jgi:hypothetical protein